MAKRKVNKSQAIRDFVKANPGTATKDVAAALAKKNIIVSTAMIATVKSKAGLTRNKRRTSPKVRNQNSNGSRSAIDAKFDLEILLEAKKLCEKAGSTSVAIEAVRAIGRLQVADN